VYLSICELNYDFIIITETWLNNSISDNECFDNRYVIYRQDRENGNDDTRGGGVLIACKNIYCCKRVNSKSDVFEIIILKCGLINGPVYICSFYIPPNASVGKYTEMFEFIVCNCPVGEKIICGMDSSV